MEHERPKVGIGVIVEKDGKILLGKRLASHGAGTWQIPGGHLEFNDTFEDTARREVMEETGLTDIEVVGLVCVINNRVYDKHFVSLGFHTRWKSGEPYAAEPEKSSDWQWFAPGELPEDIFLPSKDVIAHWKSGVVYTPEHGNS